LKRLKLVLRTAALAAALAVAGSVSPAAPSASTTAAGPPTPVCTPSWGSLVLPICV
jgi:hypothetical protein